MDNELIEIISFLLSILALFSIFTILAVKLYFKIRSYFPISVNCWFCNIWTRVPYDNRNSFYCPECTQYNGFTEDGGYNRIIEAQHRFTNTPPAKSVQRSNGLCISCNHNQQLKITQLAKFTPLIEENYDEEVEHFKNQLEKAYKLCKPCRRVLRKTLLREKASFLGNHVYNIQKKGKNIYEKVFKKSAVDNGSYLLKMFKTVQGILAVIIILKTTSDVLNGQKPEWFPAYLVPYLELYQDISTTLSLVLHYQLSVLNMQALSSFGFIMQIIPFSMEATLMCVKINQVLCWSFLALVAWTKPQEIPMNLFQIVCACLIFYNSFYEFKSNINNNKQMKKLPRSCDNSLEEDCSDDEVNEIASLYNGSTFNKTEKLTANNTINRKPKESILCSNIRSSLEDLHLSKSTFRLEKSDMSFCSRSSSPRSRQGVISPSKLNYFDQNSWVAGGFWKSDDGSIEPADKSVTESQSQSSGFCSQADVKLNDVFNGRQFNSLPTSIHHSLSGDFDRMSLASKPFFSLNSSPPSRMASFSCATPNTSFISHQSNYSLGNGWYNCSPAPTPRPIFNSPKPSLFKFSPVSRCSGVNFNPNLC